MPTSPPIRLGLIGGKWGVNYLRTVKSHPEWEIPVVARAHDLPLPTPFETIPVTTNWRSLADPSYNLQAVIIVTPPESHIEMARYFIEKGISVLVEKPLCLNHEHARRIQELANSRNITLWVDHTHLFHPAFRKLKQLTRGRMLKAIYSEAGNLGPFRDDIPAYWDWMPHDIAMILDLTGEKPVHVTARKIEREQTKHGAGETTELIMKFKSGLESVTRVTNLRLPKTRLFAVQTDNSAIRYDGIGDPSLIDISKISSEKQLLTSPGVRIPVSGPQPLEILLSEFTDAVLTRNTANESLDLACRVIEVLADGWSQLIARP